MRYLITGSSSIVGSYIVKELLSDTVRYNVDQIATISRQHRYSYDDHPDKVNPILLECYGDLTKNCIRLISQFRPTYVIHCAGEGRQNAPSKDIWRANVDTTLNLLESCKVLQKVNFVYCSSIVVNYLPLNVYAASKIAGESLCRAYSNENLTTQSVRFPAVAGAGNKHGVVKAVVEKLLDKSTDILSLYTNSKKPIIYAGDLSKCILKKMDDSWTSMYELCPADSIYVEDIAELAMEKTGITKEIRWNSEGTFSENVNIFYHMKSALVVNRSRDAVSLAIDDILKEDYGYAV